MILPAPCFASTHSAQSKNDTIKHDRDHADGNADAVADADADAGLPG